MRLRRPEHGLPFSTWSLSKLADLLVAEGVVDDISHESLRVLLREEGVTFYNRTGGVRHLFAAYDLSRDRLYGHVRPRKTRTRFLEFCRYVRSLHPREIRMAIIVDNFSPHLSTKRDRRVGAWAQFAALRYFAPDGTDHHTHQEQGSTIRRYIAWRNRNAEHRELRRIVQRANVA